MSLSSLASKLAKEGISSSQQTEPKNFLSSGFPPLDEIVSGDLDNGFAEGRIYEIYGNYSCGKTAIATQMMIAAQRKNGFAVFFDHEFSYDSGIATRNGLDLADDKFLYREGTSFEGSIVEAKKIAGLVREEMGKDVPLVMVFDSLAMMVPNSKLEKDADEYKMNDTTALARSTSAVLPAFAKTCRDMNITAVFLNQLREKPGVMYGNPETTPGGKTMGFVASTRLALSAKNIIEGGVLTKRRITAKTIKNKVNRPGLEVEWDFVFNPDGTGSFDVIGSYFDYLVDQGVVEQAGPRVVWGGGKPYASQVKEELSKNPDALELLMKLHRESKKK